MKFQILDSNKNALTLGELDKIVCEFWGVELDSKNYAKPKNNYPDWFNMVGCSIASLPNGEIPEWNRVIGKLCEVAAIGETNINDFMQGLEFYKPYIELCFYFSKQKFTAISL